MQHPKDFRKIASFLRNKTVRDCISFYYNSKQNVPYKAALKEHIQRKKRRGDAVSWEATIEAALSVGASVTNGSSTDKPIHFSLPCDDHTYYTHRLHPTSIELFDFMATDAKRGTHSNSNYNNSSSKIISTQRSLFTTDSKKRKSLNGLSQNNNRKKPNKDDNLSSEKMAKSEIASNAPDSVKSAHNIIDINCAESIHNTTILRKAPQKWNQKEKQIFTETVEKHGKSLLQK